MKNTYQVFTRESGFTSLFGDGWYVFQTSETLEQLSARLAREGFEDVARGKWVMPAAVLEIRKK